MMTLASSVSEASSILTTLELSFTIIKGFIIQATGQAFSSNLNIGECWEKFYIFTFFLFSLFRIYQPSFILTGKARNLPLAHTARFNLNDSAFTLKFKIWLKRLARENTLAFSFSLSDNEFLSTTLSPWACIIKRFYCRTLPFFTVVSLSHKYWTTMEMYYSNQHSS